MWPVPKFENETELKRRFAAGLLRDPTRPLEVACALGLDNSRASYAAIHWTNDPFVQQVQKEILATEPAESFLPTKLDTARALYELAQDKRIAGQDKAASVKAYELYCKMMGFIKDDKPDEKDVLKKLSDEQLEAQIAELAGKSGFVKPFK